MVVWLCVCEEVRGCGEEEEEGQAQRPMADVVAVEMVAVASPPFLPRVGRRPHGHEDGQEQR